MTTIVQKKLKVLNRLTFIKFTIKFETWKADYIFIFLPKSRFFIIWLISNISKFELRSLSFQTGENF